MKIISNNDNNLFLKDVYAAKGNQKPFQLVIALQGIRGYFGSYFMANEAALIYDKIVHETFDDSAHLNFPKLSTHSEIESIKKCKVSADQIYDSELSKDFYLKLSGSKH